MLDIALLICYNEIKSFVFRNTSKIACFGCGVSDCTTTGVTMRNFILKHFILSIGMPVDQKDAYVEVIVDAPEKLISISSHLQGLITF